jgi:hypothetical protein
VDRAGLQLENTKIVCKYFPKPVATNKKFCLNIAANKIMMCLLKILKYLDVSGVKLLDV